MNLWISVFFFAKSIISEIYYWPASSLLFNKAVCFDCVVNCNGLGENFVFCQFSAERVDAKLKHIGRVPVIMDDCWQDAIEKSHAPKHPFYPEGQWRGEVTRVTLVCIKKYI